MVGLHRRFIIIIIILFVHMVQLTYNQKRYSVVMLTFSAIFFVKTEHVIYAEVGGLAYFCHCYFLQQKKISV